MTDFSLIIPTRNRHAYLKKTVDIISNKYPDIEIIVSDNSDSSLGGDVDILPPNVKYFYSSELMSVVDNFEYATSKATRKYISIIGDDDILGPGINSVLTRMEANKWSCIYPWNSGYVAHFIWPGKSNDSLGKLYIKSYDGQIKSFNAKESIDSAMMYMGKGPANLPKIYQGIVSVDIINKAKKKYGKVFGGISPDIYSGVLLADCTDEIHSINAPIIVPGACNESTAGEGHSKVDRAKNKESKEHIERFNGRLNWPESIPDLYTSEIVWGYSLNEAALTIGKIIDEDSKAFFYLELMARHHQFCPQIFKSFCSEFPGIFSKSYAAAIGVRRLAKYYLPRLPDRLASSKTISTYDINNVNQVFDVISSGLENNA